MCDVKNSFNKAIMNLKALNGSGDNVEKNGTEVETKQIISGEKQDIVKISLKVGLDEHTNGNGNGDVTVDEEMSDKSKLDDAKPKEGIDSEHSVPDKPDEGSENSEYPSEVQSGNGSVVQSENTSEVKSENSSEVDAKSEVSSALQSAESSQDGPPETSQDGPPETSQDGPSESSQYGPPESDIEEPKKDQIEIVDSENEDTAGCDDEVMILSDDKSSEAVVDRDEKSMDSSASGDHPFTIGDKVKKSVRDMMTKLKQGISPEINKILVKPKVGETGESEPPHEANTSEKGRVLPNSPRTGNLFENLTVIGAGASKDTKMEEDEDLLFSDKKDKDDDTDQNDSKNSVEIIDSQESDCELIEDNDGDKKVDDDDVILFDEEKPVTSGNSGTVSDKKDNKNILDSKKDNKNILDSKRSASPSVNSSDDKDKIKLEVKPKVEEQDGTDDKPMEIDDDDDDKKDVKTDITDVKTESMKSEDCEVPGTRNDRKRSQEDSDSNPPKRSRLDMVIGKLGSQIGICPDLIKTDTSDEDSRPGSDTSEKSEDNISSVSDEEDDKTSQSSTKTIRLSGKELEALVRSKVSGYLKAHRDSKVEALKGKIDELQAANESWKNQAKELQKQVLDLTVLQQRLEKRKAATAALRQITTRSVGIQADDSKTNFSTGLAVKQAKTPPKAAPAATQSTARLSTNTNLGTMPVITNQLNSSALNQNSMTQLLTATAVPRTTASSPMTLVPAPQNNTASIPTSMTSVRSLLDTTKTIDSVGKLAVSGQPISGSNVIVVSSPALPGQVGKTLPVPKVIDLTSDEDAKAPSQTLQVIPATSVAGLRPGLVQQQVIRGVNPINIQQSLPQGTSILLSSPAGLVNPGAQNIQRPGGTFQIVTVASGSNIRPGTLLTVVPAGSTVSPQTTQIRSVVPSVLPLSKPSAVNQPMPQLRPVTSVSVTTNPQVQSQQVSVRPPPPLQTVPPVSTSSSTTSVPATPKHPAPLPTKPNNQPTKGIKGLLPPKPGLKISRVSQGIVLSWNMTVNDVHAEIASYQLFAYQETSTPPSTALWKKVGDVKALPLPMACTLTQFQEGNKYHFAVRASDVHSRIGDFSDPSTIHLTPK